MIIRQVHILRNPLQVTIKTDKPAPHISSVMAYYYETKIRRKEADGLLAVGVISSKGDEILYVTQNIQWTLSVCKLTQWTLSYKRTWINSGCAKKLCSTVSGIGATGYAWSIRVASLVKHLAEEMSSVVVSRITVTRSFSHTTVTTPPALWWPSSKMRWDQLWH